VKDSLRVHFDSKMSKSWDAALEEKLTLEDATKTRHGDPGVDLRQSNENSISDRELRSE